MPIVLTENAPDDHLRDRLIAADIPVLDEAQAARQDIRPARIGIMNNMPEGAAEKTEIQWLRWISGHFLQIVPVFMKLDDDRRGQPGSSKEKLFERYTPFSKVAEQGLDGLIITGDNLEIEAHTSGFSGDPNLDFKALPAERVNYYRQLQEVMDWADQNVSSTFYSCLGGHFGLRHKFGLIKEVNKERGKIFGVYDHEILDRSSRLVTNMNDTIRAPHSRFGDVPITKILGVSALTIVAASDEAGWLMLQASNRAGGTDVYVQAHPEYYRLDLHDEYERDKHSGLALPAGYYKDNIPTADNAQLTWATDGRALHQNWIENLVYPSIAHEET